MLRHPRLVLLGLLFTGPLLAAGNGNGGFEFSAPPEARLALTPNLWFGSDLVTSLEYSNNLDLDHEKPDHLTLLEPELRAVFAYQSSPNWRLYSEFQADGRHFFSQGDDNGDTSEGHLRVRQAYVQFPQIAENLSLTVGRQRFKDPRSWWYDERIDALRLIWQKDEFDFEVAAGRSKAFPEDHAHAGTSDSNDYYILRAGYLPKKKSEYNAYLIARRDNESDKRENPVFLGVQAVGRISSDLRYWANLAGLGGSAKGRKLRGFGADLGIVWRADLPWEPFIGLGAAFGSGDARRDDGVDRNFRQTDLQDNESRVFGRTSYNIYGEVADLELSNLYIYSLVLGLQPSDDSSIELALLRYRQVEAADELFDTDLEEDPNGRDADIGREIDLIAAYRPNKRVKFSLLIGAFFPGKAYGSDDDTAWLAKLKFSVRF